MPALIWLRRDLRLADNPALYNACKQSTDGVIALYCITPTFWQQHHEAPAKISFWLDNLASLQPRLQALNIPLVVIETEQLAQSLATLIPTLHIHSLYFNAEMEPDEQARDKQILQLCKKSGIKVARSQQACLLLPGQVLKPDGSAYKVFTPFKKQWLKQLTQLDVQCLPEPTKQPELTLDGTNLEPYCEKYRANYARETWPASEVMAQKTLDTFCLQSIHAYKTARDYPAQAGTSSLSPYLTAGAISIRQCYAATIALKHDTHVETWQNELIWREFYKHIMHFYPHVAKGVAFQRSTDQICWHDNAEHLQAWCDGQTGVPIVDAAMRQLKQTGWMHNRLRMIVAMFFSKNLFLNWRLGEQHFMQHLLDGDLSANNGGWQWSASTGTDAAPYFRIFNPYRQSERFDPEGGFIRQYCPELTALDNKQIHQPPPMSNYPAPIVDVSKTRSAAIAVFKEFKS